MLGFEAAGIRENRNFFAAINLNSPKQKIPFAADGSAATASFTKRSLVRIWLSGDAYTKAATGTAPASNSDTPLTGRLPEYFVVEKNEKIFFLPVNAGDADGGFAHVTTVAEE